MDGQQHGPADLGARARAARRRRRDPGRSDPAARPAARADVLQSRRAARHRRDVPAALARQERKQIQRKVFSIFAWQIPLFDPERPARPVPAAGPADVRAGRHRRLGAWSWAWPRCLRRSHWQRADAERPRPRAAAGEPAAHLAAVPADQALPRVRPRVRGQGLRRRSARDGGDDPRAHAGAVRRRVLVVGVPEQVAALRGRRGRHVRRAVPRLARAVPLARARARRAARDLLTT